MYSVFCCSKSVVFGLFIMVLLVSGELMFCVCAFPFESVVVRCSEHSGYEFDGSCFLQVSQILMMGESSVCTSALANVGLFCLVRYELGIRAIILLGNAELTCAISSTCICRDDLHTSLTVGWLLIIFLTIFTLAADLLFRYSSFYSSLCSQFYLSSHYDGLDQDPLFCLSPKVIRLLLFLSQLMHFLQSATSLVSGLMGNTSLPLQLRQMDLPSICPSYLRVYTVKCFFSLSFPMYPKNETQQVKILGVLQDKPSCTLAVLRLYYSLVNVLSSNLIKFGPSLEHSSGQTLVSIGLPWPGLPQKKLYNLRLWPCRSSIKATSAFFDICQRYFLMYTDQCIFLLLFPPSHLRFRSTPDRLVRQLPAATPSGLTIGTTLIQQFRRRYSAYLSLESRQSTSPSHTKELGVSPGCCLAMMKMMGLGLPLLCYWIVSTSILFFPMVFTIVQRYISSLLYLILAILSKQHDRSLVVQGQLWATHSTSFQQGVETVKLRVKQDRLEFQTEWLFLKYLTCLPPLNHPFLLRLSSSSEQMQGSNPQLNRESGFLRLTMFNLTGLFLGRLVTLKQNHCVLPLVLKSLCSSRSYYKSLTCIHSQLLYRRTANSHSRTQSQNRWRWWSSSHRSRMGSWASSTADYAFLFWLGR